MRSSKVIINAFRGLWLLFNHIEVFDPLALWKGKRIAIVGPADSAFQQENGSYIDDFNFIIRINKAIVNWKEENEKFIGHKTDILFHSFYENTISGGGPLDFCLFNKKELNFVVNPCNTINGWRQSWNYYKKYKESQVTYILKRDISLACAAPFEAKKLRPTIGYYLLYSALMSEAEEVYITGFTFFKTAYAQGYRDNLLDMNKNKEHISKHGIHDPDLEFSLFLKLLRENEAKKVILDPTLQSLVNQSSIGSR